MSDDVLPLATDFGAATEAQWRGLVDKVLKGGDFAKRLVTRTADGIAVQPLYTRKDAVLVDGAARGAPRAGAAWDIRQLHVEHDPAAANSAILDDLAGGVTSIALQIAAPGWFGLDYREAALERALRGVMLDVCPIVLFAGEYTPDAAGGLMAVWRKAGLAPAQCHGAFNYDPLGTLALTGALYHPLDKSLGIAAELLRAASAYPHVTTLLADGRLWHKGGATEAQEIALVFASTVAYLRAAETAGIKPAIALPKVAAAIAVDADQFLGIAKIRALRRGLARIAESCGAGGVPTHVTATTSFRMLSRRDPWVNMLRATIACAAAAMGGADAITVLPFTWASGRPDAFARRIARNTQIVLQEESGLGRVQDPAGGSWYVDRLTEDLASAAWAIFQDIERCGGLGAMLLDGRIQAMLAKATAERRALVVRGKFELTGTSAFPKLGDDGVTVDPWPTEKLSADLKGARATPLTVERLAEPFERLRDSADAARTAGKRPIVFLATLGPLAVHGPRAQWMRNLLAAGGIEAIGDEPLLTSADAGRAFAESGATIACLASADGVYAELGDATATLLKTAGAKAVYVAGRQKDDVMAGLKAAGVDDAVSAGGDMIATLTSLHRTLGL